MPYETGAAWCQARGLHKGEHWWSSTCRDCGAPITQAEREEADDIRAALEDIEREDLEAFGRYPEAEWDFRSRGGET